MLEVYTTVGMFTNQTSKSLMGPQCIKGTDSRLGLLYTVFKRISLQQNGLHLEVEYIIQGVLLKFNYKNL